MQNSASAFCWAIAPASVAGRHRAGQRERGRDHRLAPRRHLDEALGHRAVEAQRRVRVDDRDQARLVDERGAVDAAGDRDHLQRVVHDGRPEAEAMPRLVEVRRQRVVHVEVAGGDRQVGRLERSAALLVDDVEAADQPDVVDEVGVVAGAPAAVEVRHERRAADRAEHEVVAAEADVPFRIARVELEFAGRQRDELLDAVRVEADAARRVVDVRAVGAEQVDRPVAEHLDADLAEDPERRPMDRLDLVRAQDLDRAVRVAQRPPRSLADAGRGAARSPPYPLLGHRTSYVPSAPHDTAPASARTNGCRLHRQFRGIRGRRADSRRPSTQAASRARLPAWPATLQGRSSAGMPRMPRGGRRPSCSTSRASRGSCARPASRRSRRSRPARSPTRAGSGVRPRTTSGSPGSGGRARCSTRAAGRPGRAGGAAARSTMRARPPNPGRRATRAARRSSGRARMARSAG